MGSYLSKQKRALPRSQGQGVETSIPPIPTTADEVPIGAQTLPNAIATQTSNSQNPITKPLPEFKALPFELRTQVWLNTLRRRNIFKIEDRLCYTRIGHYKHLCERRIRGSSLHSPEGLLVCKDSSNIIQNHCGLKHKFGGLLVTPILFNAKTDILWFTSRQALGVFICNDLDRARNNQPLENPLCDEKIEAISIRSILQDEHGVSYFARKQEAKALGAAYIVLGGSLKKIYVLTSNMSLLALLSEPFVETVREFLKNAPQAWEWFIEAMPNPPEQWNMPDIIAINEGDFKAMVEEDEDTIESEKK